MRCAALLGLVVVAGCATSSESVNVTPSMAEGLCWWQGVKWDDRGPLRVTSIGEPFGRARAGWSQTTWRGAMVTGVLRGRPAKVVFDGVWAGEGLTLRAEADATSDALFTMWDPHKLSTSALVLRGAPVRLLDAKVGSALVAPSERAMTSFVPEEVPVREVKCDSLALRASLTGGRDARELLSRAGFPSDAEEVVLEADGGVALLATETPSGRFIGGFVPGSGRLFEVARTNERSRVVAIDDATLWVGWVAASGVTKRTSETKESERTKAARKELTTPTWRACTSDLQLYVRTVGGSRFVGTLHKGTRFAVTGTTDGLDVERVGIWPAVEWFEPTRPLLVAAEAAACPQVVGPW